ncbi:hypothetical protein AS026_37455 [Rhizobium altiplani]|uniref:Uncharacterized protein n=1 Tax=Rhizobium altiplani TaxID=1864509 RepID=A0A109JV91_9HYPH|nr:hypothetical protein [Rhizobium altiplani]KWV55726.1 hypothetical protein AS026_37455 [Rhizobium altiplani]
MSKWLAKIEKVGDALNRASVIIGGYFAGTFTLAMVLAVLEGEGGNLGDLVFATSFFFLGFSYVLPIPVILIVAIAEALGLRNLLYYLATWALTQSVLILSHRPLLPPIGGVDMLALANYVLAAATGGIAYWVIAGRSTKARPKRSKQPRANDGRAKLNSDLYRRP